MARAATVDELAMLRDDGQACHLYLAIHNPAVVLACRVNQVFETNDRVTEFAYDSVTSGSYNACLEGMTVWVGSSAGAYDRGMCRLRKKPTSEKIFIGLTSEIQWEDNLYITVVDDFGLWARHPSIQGANLEMMDYLTSYDGQHSSFAPVVVMGPDAVLWKKGATVSFQPTAAGSWIPGGGSITGYSWSAVGASATSEMTTATPTITYNQSGVYRLRCTVTGNGQESEGFRNVFVFDFPPGAESGGTGSAGEAVFVDDFELEDLSGDFERGGWEFEVTLYDDAAMSAVRPRAKVVLFARDWYRGEGGSLGEVSIGPVAGYENVVAIGWILEESIRKDLEGGRVTFRVGGAARWLSKLSGFAVSLADASAPDVWGEVKDLTVDKAIWHILAWRCTAAAVIDCFLSGDDRVIRAVDAPSGAIWRQIEETAGMILATPCCDRYGRLFVEADCQMVLPADRSSIPVVMDLVDGDWVNEEGEVFDYQDKGGEVSLVEVTGMYWDGTTSWALMSRAPGNIFGRHGQVETLDGVAVRNQEQLNQIAGLVFSAMNVELRNWGVKLAMNNRLMDICPRQYVRVSLAAGDTPRGIVLTNQRLIPRKVLYRLEGGALVTEVEFEGEARYRGDGVTIEVPVEPVPDVPDQPAIPDPDDPAIDFPDFPINPVNPYIPVPSPEPPWDDPDPQPVPDDDETPCKDDMGASTNGPFLVFRPVVIDSNEKYILRVWRRGIIRSKYATNRTRYQIIGRFEKYDAQSGQYVATTDDFFYQIYAIDGGGNRLLAGVHDSEITNPNQRWGTFEPESYLRYQGFELELSQSDFFVDEPTFGTFNISTIVDEGVKSVTYNRFGAVISWQDLIVRGKWIGPYMYCEIPGNFNGNVFDFYVQYSAETEGFGGNTGILVAKLKVTSSGWYDPQWGRGTEFNPMVESYALTASDNDYVHTAPNNYIRFIHESERKSEPYPWSPDYNFKMSMTWYVRRQALYRLSIDGVYIWNICGWDL